MAFETNTYASVAALRELASRLAVRVPTSHTVIETFGADASISGAPLLKVVEGADVMALITMAGVETPMNFDILGLKQRVYHPHVVKVVLAADLDESVKLGAVLGEIYKLGTKVQFHAPVDVDGKPAESDFAEDPVAIWVSDVYYPLVGSM